MSVQLSVHMEQFGSHLTAFHEIWYLSIIRKSVVKIQVSLKYDKNNGYFTYTPMYIYDNILLNYPWNEKCFGQIRREIQYTLHVF